LESLVAHQLWYFTRYRTCGLMSTRRAAPCLQSKTSCTPCTTCARLAQHSYPPPRHPLCPQVHEDPIKYAKLAQAHAATLAQFGTDWCSKIEDSLLDESRTPFLSQTAEPCLVDLRFGMFLHKMLGMLDCMGQEQEAHYRNARYPKMHRWMQAVVGLSSVEASWFVFLIYYCQVLFEAVVKEACEIC
jgi:hypothetical protein